MKRQRFETLIENATEMTRENVNSLSQLAFSFGNGEIGS